MQELESFAIFAKARCGVAKEAPSLDELFDLWRAENPPASLHVQDVEAVRAALLDFEQGDRGRPAGQLTGELRQRLGEARA